MSSIKGEMKNLLTKMSGRYDLYEVFSNWIEMGALSIQNALPADEVVWSERENCFQDIAAKYTDEERQGFAKLLALLFEAFAEGFSDILGELYMELGLGNQYTGQFFTPFCVSEMCARLGIDTKALPEDGILTINEPACGSGGMVVAACKIMKEAGFDYRRRLFVVAQDIDWKAVYMTYLQLSAIGCPALVVQGNTLTEPYDPEHTEPGHVLVTPAMADLLAYKEEYERRKEIENYSKASADPAV